MTPDQPQSNIESPDQLCRLVYISNSSLEVGHDDIDNEIEDILREARRTNVLLDVTGVLLHTERRFAQILEGRRDTVMDLFGKIRHDLRHDEVRLVGLEAIEDRTFGTWAMAYAGRHTATAARFALLGGDRPDEDGEIGTDEVLDLLADHFRES